jgi:hypothetical protein
MTSPQRRVLKLFGMFLLSMLLSLYVISKCCAQEYDVKGTSILYTDTKAIRSQVLGSASVDDDLTLKLDGYGYIDIQLHGDVVISGTGRVRCVVGPCYILPQATVYGKVNKKGGAKVTLVLTYDNGEYELLTLTIF